MAPLKGGLLGLGSWAGSAAQREAQWAQLGLLGENYERPIASRVATPSNRDLAGLEAGNGRADDWRGIVATQTLSSGRRSTKPKLAGAPLATCRFYKNR
jgi:hypothetical protein